MRADLTHNIELAREFSLKEGTDFMQSSRDKIRASFKSEPAYSGLGSLRRGAGGKGRSKEAPGVDGEPLKGTGAFKPKRCTLRDRRSEPFQASSSGQPCLGAAGERVLGEMLSTLEGPLPPGTRQLVVLPPAYHVHRPHLLRLDYG